MGRKVSINRLSCLISPHDPVTSSLISGSRALGAADNAESISRSSSHVKPHRQKSRPQQWQHQRDPQHQVMSKSTRGFVYQEMQKYQNFLLQQSQTTSTLSEAIYVHDSALSASSYTSQMPMQYCPQTSLLQQMHHPPQIYQQSPQMMAMPYTYTPGTLYNSPYGIHASLPTQYQQQNSFTYPYYQNLQQAQQQQPPPPPPPN